MTLTETATITKRFLRVFLIFGGAFLFLWIAYLYIYNNVYVPYQKSQIKAERRFGPLPKPKYPSSLLSSSSLNYTVDTRSGFLPTGFPKLIKVYFIPPLEVSLLSPDRARKIAFGLGFNDGPDILSQTQYRFYDRTGGNIVLDLTTANFIAKRGQPIAESPQDDQLPELSTIALDFKNYLNSKALIKSSLVNGATQAFYDGQNKIDSKTATVSLWPEDIETNLPIVTKSPKEALVRATVTKYKDENYHYQILNYIYWNVDKTTSSSYFLKSVDQAFEELKKGQGIVVKNQTSNSKASITKVYLAYYMSEEYSSFLEPVFVFEGDQFTAYVSALTADSYTQ